MTEEDKDKLSYKAVEGIIAVCKMHGVDFFSIDQKMKQILVSVYQEGIRQYNEEAEKIKEEHGREI